MPQEKLEFNFPTANALCLKAGGDWRISAGLPSLGEITSQLESRPEINQLAFQFSQGIIWDSAFISLLLALHRYCQQKNIRFSLEALPAEIQKLLTLALKAPQKVIPNPAVQDGFLEGVGGKALEVKAGVVSLFDFLGDLAIAFVRLITGRAYFRQPCPAFVYAARDCRRCAGAKI
jgi:phospholipid/cholesterol/gamma-HCH transport system permease protein